jgi:hypothetical protein
MLQEKSIEGERERTVGQTLTKAGQRTGGKQRPIAVN